MPKEFGIPPYSLEDALKAYSLKERFRPSTYCRKVPKELRGMVEDLAPLLEDYNTPSYVFSEEEK